MNDVVIYQNGEIELNISIQDESIWLTQKQIAELFNVKIPAISKHIKNIFTQNELIENMVVSKMEITTQHGAIDGKLQTKNVNIYSLDIVLAVGYRTNSLEAIRFRQWATKVLKQYIYNGYTINSEKITNERFVSLENEVFTLKNEMQDIKSKVKDDVLECKQGIFYNGQTFDAYKFVNDLIKLAKTDIKLLDNYIDETVLILFSKVPDIKVTIYTKNISKQLKLDLEKYNSQYNNIEIKKFENSHDRFLIIDESEVYHMGASLKDLGKKWFGFSRMDKQSVTVLDKLVWVV
jgi:prophage antirepressor-like protein